MQGSNQRPGGIRSVVEAGVAVASSWAAANHLSAGIPLSVAIGITAAIGSVVICHSLDIFAWHGADSVSSDKVDRDCVSMPSFTLGTSVLVGAVGWA